ncbi:MAG: LysE family transporter [Promethearchaeota archaeon]
MMPGPVLIMAINETLKFKKSRSWTVGLFVSIGHSILEISLLIPLWFGAANIFGQHILLMFIGVVGGSIMIFFGYLGMKSLQKSRESILNIFQKAKDHEIEVDYEKKGYYKKLSNVFVKYPFLRPTLLGLILSATSAGWWAWWASIGMGSIAIANRYVFASFQTFIVFYLGHITADFSWYGFITIFFAVTKKRINIKVYNVILIITNLTLIGMGCFFIINALV